MTAALVDPDELATLESVVQRCLATGTTDGLDVLGYGEITLVVGWPSGAPRVAAKRLPPFPDPAAAQRYGDLVSEYLEALRAKGVNPVGSDWLTTASSGGTTVGYVVQPAFPAEDLGASIVAGSDRGRAASFVADLIAMIPLTVDSRVGLDSQVSNWVMVDDELRYLDVTTPMLADGSGRTRLDLALLTRSLPAVLRPPARRWVAPGIVAAYHRPRDVVVDLIGNLWKERAEDLIDAAISEANRWVEPSIERSEIDRWYRSNARLWELMLRLRRADSFWQRQLRRRPPEFLLPGPIAR